MYVSGDPLVICDRCGFKVRKSKVKKTWDGFMVCPADWETRHPQDYLVRGRVDKQSVSDARPRPEDVFVKPEAPATETDDGTYFVSGPGSYFVSDDGSYFTMD